MKYINRLMMVLKLNVSLLISNNSVVCDIFGIRLILKLVQASRKICFYIIILMAKVIGEVKYSTTDLMNIVCMLPYPGE